MTPPSNSIPPINRRQFLLATVVALITCREKFCLGSDSIVSSKVRIINAGPVGRYATDGQYDQFLDQGFFIIRKGNELFAVSSECTHRQCKLKIGSHRSFYCPCHGSKFDLNGKVTAGPAKQDLPILPSTTNAEGQLLITVPS